MARGVKRVPCPIKGCTTTLATRQVLSQHVRKQHGTTLQALRKQPARRNPITPTKLPPMRDSSAVQIQDALLVKARGRTWIAVPIEEVFTNASS